MLDDGFEKNRERNELFRRIENASLKTDPTSNIETSAYQERSSNLKKLDAPT